MLLLKNFERISQTEMELQNVIHQIEHQITLTQNKLENLLRENPDLHSGNFPGITTFSENITVARKKLEVAESSLQILKKYKSHRLIAQELFYQSLRINLSREYFKGSEWYLGSDSFIDAYRKTCTPVHLYCVYTGLTEKMLNSNSNST